MNPDTYFSAEVINDMKLRYVWHYSRKVCACVWANLGDSCIDKASCRGGLVPPHTLNLISLGNYGNGIERCAHKHSYGCSTSIGNNASPLKMRFAQYSRLLCVLCLLGSLWLGVG